MRQAEFERADGLEEYIVYNAREPKNVTEVTNLARLSDARDVNQAEQAARRRTVRR